ncbi:MAG: DUF4139 domain-containing protein [Flavobacteriales bacterium]|nr:DUF4139 domain-containing protein [Flavobacteriales bacterium]
MKRKTTNTEASVGSKRTVTIGWDITVRNTKVTAIDLEVRDRYPLSPQSEIEVKLEGTRRGHSERADRTSHGDLIYMRDTEARFSAMQMKYPKKMPVVLE